MGEGFIYLLIGAEVEDFGYEFANVVFVVERDAVDADKGGNELEVKVWVQDERFGPVVGDGGLSFEVASRFVHDTDDDGRGHLEIVRVVGEDAREIARVP